MNLILLIIPTSVKAKELSSQSFIEILTKHLSEQEKAIQYL